MEKLKFGYGWLVKFILAAILIAAGILLKVYEVQVVYASTGIAIVLFSLLRVVPLLKTLKREVLRTINLIEIIFDTIMGGLMIYIAFAGLATDAFWVSVYGYLLAVFFYARAIIYFVSMYYFGEKTEGNKFWFHIVCITMAPAVFVLTILNQDIITTLGWLVLFISVSGGAYLGYDGFGGYQKYRQSAKKLNEEKPKEKQPLVEKELPRPQAEAQDEKQIPAS